MQSTRPCRSHMFFYFSNGLTHGVKHNDDGGVKLRHGWEDWELAKYILYIRLWLYYLAILSYCIVYAFQNIPLTLIFGMKYEI